MPSVDWMYHRKNCDSCAKATDFLQRHEVAVTKQVDARTIPLVEADALRLVSESDDLYVTRGKKVFHYSLRTERPSEEDLLSLLIGRSGKLRAPALQVGRVLVVGFDQPTYERVFRSALTKK